MVSELILYVVAVTLIVIIVAMVRQRSSPSLAPSRPETTAPDLWTRPSVQPVPPPRPVRDTEAAAREVLAHLRVLEERGSPGLTSQVMPVFLKDTLTRLDALRLAIAEKDGSDAHRIAHTLHGSAATVGASTMVTTSAEIIREVRCGAFDRCPELIADLTSDFEAIQRAAAKGVDGAA